MNKKGNSEVNYVKFWQTKRQVAYLEDVLLSQNTSCISLFIRPGEDIVKIRNFLSSEIARAVNIKSMKNRSSVQDGLNMIVEILKKYSKVPENGLVCYTAAAKLDPTTNKEQKLKLLIEPPNPVTESIYNCSKDIIIEPLKKSLCEFSIIGFIIVDGQSVVMATVKGSIKKIMLHFDVDLPRKHCKGGQSQNRFQRLRLEKKHYYLRKLCESAELAFVQNNKATIDTLIIAGVAQVKDDLEKCPDLHQTLKDIRKYNITISHGGNVGLDEAIKKSAEFLDNCRLGDEIKIISKFLELLHEGDSDLIVFTAKETVDAMIEGIVDVLIVWEHLPLYRYVLQKGILDDIENDKPVIEIQPAEWMPADRSLQVMESCLLVEWLVEVINQYNTKIEIISDSTKEGNMFIKGFGGIGGLLRYRRSTYELSFDEMDGIDIDEY